MSMNAIILIDYINDICHPDGLLFGDCARAVKQNGIIPKLNKTLEHVRKNDWLVLWIVVGFDKSYSEVNLNSPMFSFIKNKRALIKETWGTQILDDISHQNELIIYKNSINAFHATNLDHMLRANNVSHLYIAGVSTDMAIQSTARDAHDKGYKVSVIADLCAGNSEEQHTSSLTTLSRLAVIIEHDQIYDVY